MDELWKRVRDGQHTAVLGLSPGDLPSAAGVLVVRVRCDVPPSTLGPLHEARLKVDHLLGSHPPLFDQARERMMSGLRRRLLGEEPAGEAEGALVEAWNRLAASSTGPAALLFEAIDAADDATLATLRRIVARPGWLRVPLVIAFRSDVPAGAAAGLLEALQRHAGAGCVLRAGPAAASSPRSQKASSPPPASGRPALEPGLRALPHDVVRVLRAGALVGSGFEADLVAALLHLEVFEVLELVQRAADAGVPVEDRGEGRFHLPEPLLDTLRASMLPSLMVAQHRRLAELLGGFDDDEDAFSAPFEPVMTGAPRTPPIMITPPVMMGETSQPHPAQPVMMGEAPAQPGSVPTERDAGVSPWVDEPAPGTAPSRWEGEPERPLPGAWPYAEIFGGAPLAAATVAFAAPDPPSAPREESPPRSVAPPRSLGEPATRSRPSPRLDDARAAGHLAAAGDLDASAERYFVATQKAAATGAYAQAMALADKALAALATLPESTRRRRLRAGVLLEVGRLRWITSAPDADFTLADAVEVLDAARRDLGVDDPPELRAAAAVLVAAVCYDIGDAPALARALGELSAASRLLVDAGDPTGAARLLNDQAAVYVRLGDPVRATHLLSESRRVFEARAATDPVAMVEMAETDHLFARIPLHVPARAGREADALTMGLDHALAAERAYHKLDARRELGRVWETMGRLELRRGRVDRARERLAAAVQIEEAIGDVVGLARSTAALSGLLATTGRYPEALGVLGDSVALNFEKGSPIGLAFNRRALDALASRAEGAAGTALGEVERQLGEAEAVLGKMRLPGEGD